MGLITRDEYVEWASEMKWHWRPVTVWRLLGLVVYYQTGGWRAKGPGLLF